jgi:hypothetical protein
VALRDNAIRHELTRTAKTESVGRGFEPHSPYVRGNFSRSVSSGRRLFDVYGAIQKLGHLDMVPNSGRVLVLSWTRWYAPGGPDPRRQATTVAQGRGAAFDLGCTFFDTAGVMGEPIETGKILGV